MFKVEPNRTGNQPDRLPYLIRNLDNSLIIRYCTDLALAEKEADRLNGIGRASDATPAPDPEPAPAKDVAIGENLSLF